MTWCQTNVEDFTAMNSASRHGFASQLQVKVALLQERASDVGPGEAESVPSVKTMKAGYGTLGNIDTPVPSRKTAEAVGNTVCGSALDITSRIIQAGIAHKDSIVVWAWCVLNVSGFANSDTEARKEVKEAVTKHLIDGGYMVAAVEDKDNEDEDEEARKKRRSGTSTWRKPTPASPVGFQRRWIIRFIRSLMSGASCMLMALWSRA